MTAWPLRPRAPALEQPERLIERVAQAQLLEDQQRLAEIAANCLKVLRVGIDRLHRVHRVLGSPHGAKSATRDRPKLGASVACLGHVLDQAGY